VSVFAALLGHEALAAYLDAARAKCRANLRHLASGLPPGWSANEPVAGAFACVSSGIRGFDSVTAQSNFLAAGVDVVTAMPFFSDAPPPHGSFVRLALAREEAYFAEATARIFAACAAVAPS